MAGIAGLFLLPAGGTWLEAKTRSPEFCGSCHFERSHYDTWKESSHAIHRTGMPPVGCVDCHVRKGTGGYLEGKARGLRHVSVAFLGWPHTEPVPWSVRTEVASETCLGCHQAVMRIDTNAPSDLPLIHAEFLEANDRPESARAALQEKGLRPAHRTHMALVEECLGCHATIAPITIEPAGLAGPAAGATSTQLSGNSGIARYLPQNPMGCVSCHEEVAHANEALVRHPQRPIEKYPVHVPHEQRHCGLCHSAETKCVDLRRRLPSSSAGQEEGRNQSQRLWTIENPDTCNECHTGGSDVFDSGTNDVF